MTKKQRHRRHLLITIAVLSLVLTSLCGVAQARYVTTKTINDSVNISADIGTIVLQEHLYIRDENGAYTKTDTLLPVKDDPETTENEGKTGNEYRLIPGLDIPKDPHLVITKDNNIPVYVYVEVVDGLGTNSGITYRMSNWVKLDGVTGPHNGAVYYYKDPVDTSGTIYILDENTVFVSQYLDKNQTSLNLTFYAFMYQTAAGTDAADVYAKYNSTP